MFVAVFLIVAGRGAGAGRRPGAGDRQQAARDRHAGRHGRRAARLRRAFLWLGALLAGVGALGGGALGCARGLDARPLPARAAARQVYFLDYVPFRRVPVADLLPVVARHRSC